MELMPQSPSSVGTYYVCPKQYQAKYITREIKFQPNEATERGSRWHKHLELRMAKAAELPSEVAHFEVMMKKMDSFRGDRIIEARLAVDSKFNACDYKARYIGGSIDLGFIDHERCKATLFDYKTGKVKDNPDFRFQLMVYALLVFKNYPHIRTVRCAYLFLDHCQISPMGDDGRLGLTYTREDIAEMQGEVLHKIDRIRSATERNEWIPNPGPLCRPNRATVNGGKPWCQVKSCPFWNKR